MKNRRARTPVAPAPASAESGAQDPRSPTLTAWTWVIASVIAVTSYAIAAPLGVTAYGLPVLGSLGIALLQMAPLPLAIAQPWIAIALSGIGILVFGQLAVPIDGAPWPWSVPALVLQCAMLAVLGLRERWTTGAVAWVVSVFMLLPLTFETAGIDQAAGILNITIVAPVLALVLAVSVLFAQRQRIRAQLFRERALSASEQSRREVVEDRNRIARELHDVVAHSMSIIQVQATSAPYRLPQLDEQTRGEFAEIAASARLAMREMRQLLGVLRSEEAEAAKTPQPGIAALDELLESVRRAGVPATLKRGEALPSSGLVDTAVYRIVQEALSNVVRHAPGAETAVEVTRDGSVITATIENRPAPNGRPQGAGGQSTGQQSTGGHGLVGIRERVALLGGSAQLGPTPSGGFRVHVTIPDVAPPAPADVPPAPPRSIHSSESSPTGGIQP